MSHLIKSPSSSLQLMMHVAVQAARHTLETTGLCLSHFDAPQGYSFYGTQALCPWVSTPLEPDAVAAHLAELSQAAKLLVSLHLAVAEEFQGKTYIRLVPHVEDYMQVLA